MSESGIELLYESIVYKDKNFYPSFPSIVKLNENNYLISFRLAPKLSRGYSHLHSLSKAMLLVFNNGKVKNIFEIGEDDDAAKQDAQLFRYDEDTILAYYFRYTFHPRISKKLLKNYTYLEYENTIALLSGVGVSISKNNGESFSSPYLIKVNDMKNFAIRGSLCRVDSSILMPIYAYKENNNKYYSYILSSKDFENWRLKSFLTETEKYDKVSKREYVEPSLLSYKNNIFAFIRTHDSNGNSYISISYSKNKGQTFSKPLRTNILGYPLHPLLLSDNRVFLCYGYRLKPYGVRAIVLDSIDDLFDIDKINYMVDRAEIIIENKMSSADCGYPWCVEDNGSIVCVYYGHQRSVRSIYLKKFNLKS